MIRIVETSDKELLTEILKDLKENNNHCPCQLDKESRDTICMCKKFRDDIQSADIPGDLQCDMVECPCGRYIAYIS